LSEPILVDAGSRSIAPGARNNASCDSNAELTRETSSAPFNAVELWIPASIAIVVGLRWLLGERHSVYGDEAYHLTNLFLGINGAARGGMLDRVVHLYLFNWAYPPLFHLLAAPFVLFSADPVFGGRVYAQVLTLLVALTMYSATRQIGGKMAGIVAVATLLGTPSFVDPSRHYLLETLLVLEVLVLLHVIGRYYESRRLSDLLIVAFVITAGLLTKFNFFFYAAWLVAVPMLIECYRAVRGLEHWSGVARFAAVIMVVPLVIAGPWYLARASGPASSLYQLADSYAAGSIVPGVTLRVFTELVLFTEHWNYSPLVTALAVAAAVIYGGQLLQLPILRQALKPMKLSQHVVVAGAFLGVVCVPPVLAFTGMGAQIRWHIEAVYFFLATFGVLGRLSLAPARRLGLAAAGVGAILQLSFAYAVPLRAPEFLRVPDLGYTPRPSAVAVGSEIIALDIERNERRLGGTRPGEFAYFLYHEHRGPHFGSVEFYLRLDGVPLEGRWAGWWNRAIDLENIFGAKYLVRAVSQDATGMQWHDPETERYRRLAEHFPASFENLLVEVSDVQGRFGHFKAYHVPHERITREMVLETIETGRQLETVEPFLVLWDAQRVLWRAKFEAPGGNASLHSEIESVLARAPLVERALIPINRQTLQDYVVRIKEIRSRVSDASPLTSVEPRREAPDRPEISAARQRPHNVRQSLRAASNSVGETLQWNAIQERGRAGLRLWIDCANVWRRRLRAHRQSSAHCGFEELVDGTRAVRPSTSSRHAG
jgi:hypothetical protein